MPICVNLWSIKNICGLNNCPQIITDFFRHGNPRLFKPCPSVPKKFLIPPVPSSHTSQIILSNVCDFESQRHRFSLNSITTLESRFSSLRQYLKNRIFTFLHFTFLHENRFLHELLILRKT